MPISAPDPLLAIADLSTGYGKIGVLRGVDLTVGAGEVVALLGPNGAGKTTLISIICGIVTPSSGKVVADGHDVVRDYRAARTKIGLVPQELAVSAFETVWGNVSF